MPPRHAYWTILIGDSPTAFRAREREELLPTFERLRAKQPDAVMKWFERGRLWPSPEDAHGGPPVVREKRGAEWRPGGAHRDPRDRFKRGKAGKGAPQAGGERVTPSDDRRGPAAGRPGPPAARGDRAWTPKPGGAEGRGPKDEGRRPWSPKPPPPRGDRRWTPKPGGAEGRGPKDEGRRPWSPKPPAARGDRPWTPKPGGAEGRGPKDERPLPDQRVRREERGRKAGTRLVKKVRR